MGREEIGLFLGPIVFLILVLAPPLPGTREVATQAGIPAFYPQFALGVLLWTAIWWVAECVPLGLAALIPPILFSFAGIISWKDALMRFTHPIIWIFMAGFVITKAFQVWGLDKRIALRLALMYKGDNPMVATLFVACIPVFLLTITGSITASTSIVYPIALAYLTAMGFSRESRYAEATMLALGQAATAGAMLFLISTPPNLIAKGVIEEKILELVSTGVLDSRFEGFTLSFFDWLIVGTPHALIGLLISWIVTFYVIKPEARKLRLTHGVVREELEKMGRLSLQEKIVLCIFILTVILWMIPGFFLVLSSVNPAYIPISKTITKVLPEAAPAVLAILLLGLIRVRGKPLLSWSEIEDGIDWNVVFLFGGGLALGKALDSSGFSLWLVQLVSNIGGLKMDLWTVTAIGAVLGFLITYPASNTASTIVAAPIAATISIAAGINPVPAVIATGLACSISSALPSTTPPMAIVYGSKTIKLWNMFKVGMISDTIRLLILIALSPYLTTYLLELKGMHLYLHPP